MIYKGKQLIDVASTGWGDIEGGQFLWSIDPYASIIVPIKKQVKPFGVQLVMEPFIHPVYKTQQSIEIFCNGLFVLGQAFEISKQDILFFEVHPSVSAFGVLKFDFVFPGAKSPKNLTISEDRRILGFKIFELQIIT